MYRLSPLLVLLLTNLKYGEQVELIQNPKMLQVVEGILKVSLQLQQIKFCIFALVAKGI